MFTILSPQLQHTSSYLYCKRLKLNKNYQNEWILVRSSISYVFCVHFDLKTYFIVLYLLIILEYALHWISFLPLPLSRLDPVSFRAFLWFLQWVWCLERSRLIHPSLHFQRLLFLHQAHLPPSLLYFSILQCNEIDFGNKRNKELVCILDQKLSLICYVLVDM